VSDAGSAVDWDAETYHRISDFQFEWGCKLLDRLELRGDETVLDAGCGSGRVTKQLMERLPRGRVIAVDASPSMVEKARVNLGPRATVGQASLAELDLDEPVDAILSTSVFHWLPDHDKLFARLAANLGPGGQLVARMGVEGNAAALVAATNAAAAEEPFAAAFDGWSEPWNFAPPESVVAAIEKAGFGHVAFDIDHTTIHPREGREFLRVVVLGSHLEQLAEPDRDRFVDAVAARATKPVSIEHVQMNVTARRGS
jgi:trans-aconitate 2-methyltransferase